jgi:protein transport protein SEC31
VGGCEIELYTIPVYGDAPRLNGAMQVTTATNTNFVSIAWSKQPTNSILYPMGIIAGGMADGTIILIDPHAICNQHNGNSNKSSHGIVSTIPPSPPSSGPIVAMQFSPLSVHHLCTGAYNGRVTIVDCTDPTQPVCTEPGQSTSSSNPPTRLSTEPTKAVAGAEITAVAWNTAVPHIVATASGDGMVVVWDVQSNVKWCEIRSESVGHAVSDIVWNPSEGLHLLTASGDDRNPVLRLWDLGTSTTVPLGTLIGHSAGIFCAAWCPHDDSLLLSVGKDNRTFLWDLRTLQAVAELPMDATPPSEQQPSHSMHSANALFASGRPGLQEQKQMRYDIQWSPHQRGVALTCSLDRKIQIHTLLSLVSLTGRPPAWMTRKSSITTGFGGVVVSCRADSRTVSIQTIPEHPLFAETASGFDNDMTYYQASHTINDFCKIMENGANISDHDKALWGFMQVVFETNARQQLLYHLGFIPEDIAAAAKQYSATTAVDMPNGTSTVSTKDSGAKVAAAASMSPAIQDLVKMSLLVGNFEAAVDCCFETGNYGDALMLAACGGGDLWLATQQRYFDSEAPKRPFLSLVSGIIRNQLDDLVAQSDVATWRETLAILSTYAQSEEFPNLCVMLGDRLKDGGDDSSASLCYMCALNLERTVQYWTKQVNQKVKSDFTSTADLLALHEFVMKVCVFLLAVGPSVGPTPEIELLYTRYAQALTEQGLLVTATKYCYGGSATSKELRDRLYRSRSSHQCFAILGTAPEFPYVMSDVQQSRGQVCVQPIVAQKEPPLVSNGYNYPQNQQQAVLEHHDTNQHGFQHVQPHSVGSSDALAPGWIAFQDPTSGNMYYANETTGETTWDMPKAPTHAPYSAPQAPVYHDAGIDASQRSQTTMSTTTASKQKPSLVSKYGDGFVSSASNPELAQQYGNVCTSNPYGGNARPGPAAVQSLQKAPVSGSLNLDSLQLSNHHASIKDTLLGATDALKRTALNVVEKKQLDEAEKGIAILVKKLARDDLSDAIVDQVFALVNAISQHDFVAALAYQTTLANSEWRDHKDWLKGIKILIQLASKKF